MDNNYIWTSRDYIKLFEKILNISLEEDTFFVTGVGKNGKSKPKLINKKTNTSCKIKVYFSQIKMELGNNCFKQYTVKEIHEKLSAQSLEIIYKQMIQTRVIKDGLSSITFDQTEYEEIFKKDHAEVISKDIEMKKQFFETLRDSNSLKIALRCINAVDGYGRTTYTELLKGSETQKMNDYSLNRSQYYGMLKQLTKKAIEEIIAILEEHRIIETYYGRYDRSKKYPKLRLTVAGIDKLNELFQKENKNIESTEITVAMPLPFFEKLNMYTPQEKAKLFKSIDISKYTEIEFMKLLQFVLTRRSEYKDAMDGMIEAFSTMPKKYIPIIEMNSELETGVVKETLKMIIKSVKERNIAC